MTHAYDSGYNSIYDLANDWAKWIHFSYFAYISIYNSGYNSDMMHTSFTCKFGYILVQRNYRYIESQYIAPQGYEQLHC